MPRIHGSYSFRATDLERTFRLELQRSGYSIGKRMAQMVVERHAAGDWRGEIAVMEVMRNWQTPRVAAAVQAELAGQLTLIGWEGVRDAAAVEGEYQAVTQA